jgi:hypothetical protein
MAVALSLHPGTTHCRTGCVSRRTS